MELRVLIVDDSPAMRAFIRRVLEMSGLEVAGCLEASNGEEALRLLEHNWVDAVLTDINMPQMDGEEFMRRLAEDEVLRLIPVLVISTDATESRMQKMVALGAKGYVTKPFAPETLRAELERSLGTVHAAK
jgi:two-component system, chemotaxis family, chemotaxis protein CheY